MLFRSRIEGIPALDPARRDFDSNRLLARDADDEVVAQLRQRFLAQLRDRERRPPVPATRVRMLEKTPKNALRIPLLDRKSTRLNSSHYCASRMPSSAGNKKH